MLNFSYLCMCVYSIMVSMDFSAYAWPRFPALVSKKPYNVCICVCVSVHSNEGVISLPRVLRALPFHTLIPIFLPVVPFIPPSSLIQILASTIFPPPCLHTHFLTYHTHTHTHQFVRLLIAAASQLTWQAKAYKCLYLHCSDNSLPCSF